MSHRITLSGDGVETLFGSYDEHLKRLEALFDVRIRTQGHDLIVDGDAPGPASPSVPAGGIRVTNRNAESNTLSMIPGTATVNQHTDGWFPPRGTVPKSTVLRATAFAASGGHGARWPEPSIAFDALHAALHRAFPDIERNPDNTPVWEHAQDRKSTRLNSSHRT